MTLIVSLRIPDGIIIAGDSLSTMVSNIQLEGAIDIECPNCKHAHKTTAKIPTGVRTNFLSNAQKVFSFMNKFGVGTFGNGQLMGKTIYFAVRELEANLLKNKTSSKTLSVMVDILSKHLKNLLDQQLKLNIQNGEQKLPDNQFPVGFQMVGYEEEKPTLAMVQIGNEIKKEISTGLGITYSGQPEVVTALFSRFEANPQEKPIFDFFSLQDAITYAEFLIQTTSTYQRFSSNMAMVGGEIDIALITPFDGFKWIKQKSLQAKLSSGLLNSKNG